MRKSATVLAIPLFLAALAASCGGSSSTPLADLGQGDTAGETGQDNPAGDDAATGENAGDPGSEIPACTSECDQEGDKDCYQGGVRTCSDADDDGCLEWSAPEACEDGKTCSAGACIVTCANAECSVIGAHKCGENNEVLECGDFDGDHCLEWGNPVPCQGGLVCSQGYCATSCTSACTTIGARKCDLNTVVVCGDYNTDGCLEWGDPEDCGTLVCASGYCKSECVNECTQPDARKCDGNGYKVCGNIDADPCLEYGTVINCSETQTCSNGWCNDTCQSECTAKNARKCDESGAVVVCDDWDDDPCLEWGSPKPCDQGLVCAGGFCESQCQDECTVKLARKCDEAGNVVLCDEHDGDGCLEWGSGTPCASPLVCDQGNCKLSCTDECSVKNSRRCTAGAANQYEICDETDGDGCLEWGSPLTCDGTLVCSGQGECTVSCESECATVDQAKCEGNAVRICDDYNGDTCLEWGTAAPCELWQQCTNGACQQKEPPAKVVIGEILFDAVGTDYDVFVELSGPAGTDLTGWTLIGVNGNKGLDYKAIPLAGAIGADGYFVVAHPNSAAAIHDQGDQFDMNVDYENGPDNVQLRYGTRVVDAIGYGDFGTTYVFAGEGAAVAKPSAGHSLSRDEANTDTDDNAADFVDRATPTPGAANIAVNEKPVASLSCPGSVVIGQTVTADGSASNDSDGDIVTFAFDFGDGGAVVTGASATAQHAYETSGTKTITLTVTDNGGLADSTTCQVAVGDDKVPTVLFIKPADDTQVTQGSTINALVDATPTAGRSIASVQLLVDGVPTGDPDTTVPYEFTYVIPQSQPKDSTVVLQAKAIDSAGSTGISDGVHLLVRNDPPVPSFTAVVSGALEVTVDASASTDTETATGDLKVRGDFNNDGTWETEFSTTKVATWIYPSEGTQTIRMEIQDGIGQTATLSKDITLSSMQVVSGSVTTTTWTGTIVVTGDVVVPAGNTLTIAEGTSILFTYIDQNADGTGDYDLTINGTLKVNGTAGKPVLFTVYGADHKHAKAWNRITLNGTGSTVDFAIVEYADIGFEVRDDATVRDTTVRLCTQGLYLQDAGKTATLTRVTSTRNTGDGVASRGGTHNATQCNLTDNGGRGAFVQGGTFNLSNSTVSGNTKAGLEWLGQGGGTVTRNLVTGNGLEGVRITWNSGDPTPVVNYNNILGNALQKARVVVSPGISAVTDASYSGTKTSSAWSTPGGEAVQWIRVSYSEYDYDYYNYENGYVRKDGASGTQVWSASTPISGWTDVSSHGATTLVVQVTDNHSSSYYGSTSLDRAAFEQAGAVREMSVITASGNVDLKHNYWGAFPKALDVLTIGTPGAANIEGFVGVPFDATWSKGPYVGGETISAATTWSGDIFVTGNLSVSGTTLTVDAGTKVQFAPIDQDGNGVGDYTLDIVNTTFTVNGTSGSPVTFTTAGPPAAKSFQEVKVRGTGTSTIHWTTFENGHTGLRLETGSHTLTDVTLQDDFQQGLWLRSNTGASDQVTLTRVTARRNSRGIKVESVKNLTANYLTLQDNTGDGMHVSSSTSGLALSNSTIANNGGNGLYFVNSSVAVDHCNIQYNLLGVRYDGTSAGSLYTSTVKYNDREGVLLWSTGSGNPNPVIGGDKIGNNLFGNAVKWAGTTANPSLSATTDASYSGTKTSPPWSTPAGETILAIRVTYSEYDYDYYNYENGFVRKDNASGTQVFSASTSTSGAFVDLQSHNATTLVAQVTDNHSSSYYGSTVVDIAYYYASNEPTVVKPTELSAITNGGKVACTHNYWGAFPDPTPRFSLGRTDAIDYQGFQATAYANVGPQ